MVMRRLSLLAVALLAGCVSGPSPYDALAQEEARFREMATWCLAHQDVICLPDLEAQAARIQAAEARVDAYEQRRSANSAALLAVGQSYLQPRRPVICTTSDTTNPTTVCQ